MFYKKRNNKAFTLLELIVVVIIISILTAGLVGVAAQIGTKNAEKETLAVINTVDVIISEYYDAMGRYPYQAIDCTGETHVGALDKGAYPDSSSYTAEDSYKRHNTSVRNSIFLIKQLRKVDSCSKALDAISSKRLIKIDDNNTMLRDESSGNADSFDNVFDKNYDCATHDISSDVADRYGFSTSNNKYYECLVDGFGNPINYQLVRKRNGSDNWVGKGRAVLISAGKNGEFGAFGTTTYMDGAAEDDIRSDKK